MKSKLYEILRETDTLEVVAFIGADSVEEAREKAKAMGYGKAYRVEESWEG